MNLIRPMKDVTVSKVISADTGSNERADMQMKHSSTICPVATGLGRYSALKMSSGVSVSTALEYLYRQTYSMQFIN